MPLVPTMLLAGCTLCNAHRVIKFAGIGNQISAGTIRQVLANETCSTCGDKGINDINNTSTDVIISDLEASLKEKA